MVSSIFLFLHIHLLFFKFTLLMRYIVAEYCNNATSNSEQCGCQQCAIVDKFCDIHNHWNKDCKHSTKSDNSCKKLRLTIVE